MALKLQLLSNNSIDHNNYLTMRYVTCECDELFYSEDMYQEHVMKTDHNVIKRDITTIQCKLCTKVFYKELSFNAHFDIVHNGRPNPFRGCKSSNPESASNTCPECGKMFKHKAALYTHKKIHTGLKPFKCPYCEKAFSMKTYLQTHIRIHTKEKPYQCDICPMAFSGQSNFIRHKFLHTGQKPHACEQCGKKFATTTDLKQHINGVHLKIPVKRKARVRKTKKPELPEIKSDNFSMSEESHSDREF